MCAGHGIAVIEICSDQSLKFGNGHADTSVDMNHVAQAATASRVEETAAQERDILTVEEVARFLRVPKSTVYKLARVGELPASKIGKHWRFLRRDIHEWLHSRSQQN